MLHGLRIGALNIGTYRDKEEEILQIMKEKKIDIMGLAETRLRGNQLNRNLGDGYIISSSGIDQGTAKHGVAIIMGPRVSQYIIHINLKNKRIIKATIKCKSRTIHIFQVYAPQQGRPMEEKIHFYEELEEELSALNLNSGNCIVIGDLNGRVGNNRTNLRDVIGPFGEETINTEEEMLLDFCLRNNLSIMNSYFKHQDSHIYTRYRWNQNTQFFDQRSIIDYIISSDKRIVKNIKVLPGISLDSDHRLLIGDLQIEINRKPRAQKVSKIKVEALKEENKVAEYRDLCEELSFDKNQDIEAQWQEFKGKMSSAAKMTLGKKLLGGTRRRHTPWWNEELKNAVKDKMTKLRK